MEMLQYSPHLPKVTLISSAIWISHTKAPAEEYACRCAVEEGAGTGASFCLSLQWMGTFLFLWTHLQVLTALA